MKNTLLKISSPAPGCPPLLDMSSFENLSDFQNAIESNFKSSFPGVSLDDFTAKAKSDIGFASIFAPLVAMAYHAGASSAKVSAIMEATLSATRATTAAAAAKPVEKCFADLVTEQTKSGKTKGEAVKFCVKAYPAEYAKARSSGGLGKL